MRYGDDEVPALRRSDPRRGASMTRRRRLQRGSARRKSSRGRALDLPLHCPGFVVNRLPTAFDVRSRTRHGIATRYRAQRAEHTQHDQYRQNFPHHDHLPRRHLCRLFDSGNPLVRIIGLRRQASVRWRTYIVGDVPRRKHVAPSERTRERCARATRLLRSCLPAANIVCAAEQTANRHTSKLLPSLEARCTVRRLCFAEWRVPGIGPVRHDVAAGSRRKTTNDSRRGEFHALYDCCCSSSYCGCSDSSPPTP